MAVEGKLSRKPLVTLFRSYSGEQKENEFSAATRAMERCGFRLLGNADGGSVAPAMGLFNTLTAASLLAFNCCDAIITG
jgi:hypothetical protein